MVLDHLTHEVFKQSVRSFLWECDNRSASFLFSQALPEGSTTAVGAGRLRGCWAHGSADCRFLGGFLEVVCFVRYLGHPEKMLGTTFAASAGFFLGPFKSTLPLNSA